MTLAVGREATARALDTTPLRLLRDKRLAVVLVRLRTLTHSRLPNRVTNVALVVDGGGDVLRRATVGLATAELLDQHAENVTVVDNALVVVPDVRHTEILAADVDTAVGALPVRSDTGSLIAGVGRAGPGCVTVVLGSPGRCGLRVATASSTRRRSRCTGVDAGVVGSTRTTATRGRGTAGTAVATSAALTADGTSTTRPGVTTLPTNRTVTRRSGRVPGRPGSIPALRRRVTTSGASSRAGRLRATDLGEPTRSGIPTRAGAVTTRPARTGTAGRVGVTTRTARTRTTGAGRTSRTGTTRGVTTCSARTGTTGPASAAVRSTARTGRTCATRTGRTSTGVGSTTSTAVTAGRGPARSGATRGGSARSGGTRSITTGAAAPGTASTAARVTRGISCTSGAITGT